MAEKPIGVITSNCKVTARPRRQNAHKRKKIVIQMTNREKYSKIYKKIFQEYNAEANLMISAYTPPVSAVNKAMYKMYSDARR